MCSSVYFFRLHLEFNHILICQSICAGEAGRLDPGRSCWFCFCPKGQRQKGWWWWFYNWMGVIVLGFLFPPWKKMLQASKLYDKGGSLPQNTTCFLTNLQLVENRSSLLHSGWVKWTQYVGNWGQWKPLEFIFPGTSLFWAKLWTSFRHIQSYTMSLIHWVHLAYSSVKET